MVVDFDDFREHENRFNLLERLREINPAFRCTLFAIPTQGSAAFWASVPDWCELAMHGWSHPHPQECAGWSYERALEALDNRPPGFAEGFKAPGWQMSDGTYYALVERGFWLADHWENNHRRPKGIRCHVISMAAARLEDPDHWHGHIDNVCGNGIEETWDALAQRVSEADHFEFVSEVVEPW